jgi:hypothetical protein
VTSARLGKNRSENTKKSPFVNAAEAGNDAPGRLRAATFVQTDDLSGGKATKLSGTANAVTRAKLKSGRPPIVGTDRTVFFKAHNMEAPSQYAVASTRLARFVGMPTVIAHNAFARIKGVEGVVSGKVPGVALMTPEFATETKVPKGTTSVDDWMRKNNVVKRKGKYYARSAMTFPRVDLENPVVQKGLSDLQLFDALSGQADRHGGNIYVDPVTGEVTGIDDDWSFGEGQRADDVEGLKFKKSHYLGLPKLVDADTAESILAADPDGLAQELARRATDTEPLTPKHINDARRRLETVQAYLQGLKDRGELVTDWDDATYGRAAGNPGGSYLGRQAEMLAHAEAGTVPEGHDPGLPYVAVGPTVPPRATPATQPPPVTAPVMPAMPATPWRPTARPQGPASRNLLGQPRFQPPQVFPPLPPDPPPPGPGPTRSRAIQPQAGLQRMVRNNDSPRRSATIRLRLSGVDPLPTTGDPTEEEIESLEPGAMVALSNVGRSTDDSTEDLERPEGNREGFVEVELSDGDVVHNE